MWVVNMVDVAQRLGHLSVEQETVGSNPIIHPKEAGLIGSSRFNQRAPVAQSDRVAGFEPVGCAFKSRRGLKRNRPDQSVDRAVDH